MLRFLRKLHKDSEAEAIEVADPNEKDIDGERKASVIEKPGVDLDKPSLTSTENAKVNLTEEVQALCPLKHSQGRIDS